MTLRFRKRLREARTFEEWLERLRRFNYALIKANRLQAWTKQDFKNYWQQHKETL